MKEYEKPMLKMNFFNGQDVIMDSNNDKDDPYAQFDLTQNDFFC